jgi:hypothetical protein
MTIKQRSSSIQMIRKSTTTGLLTLAALVVLGAFSAGSALAKGGPNSVFVWTGALPALVLVLSDNKQVFKTSATSPAIECDHFGAHGVASNGKAMTTKAITVRGTYSKCIAAGAFPASVTPAEFEVKADGSVSIVGAPIVITIPEANCSIKITNGGANSNLRLILYLNQKEDLLAHIEVNKINSVGSGIEPCGEAGVVKENGTYTGLLLVRVDGGTLQWRE